MSDSYKYRSWSNPGFDIERALNLLKDTEGASTAESTAKFTLWHLWKRTNGPKEMFQDDKEEAEKIVARIDRQQWYFAIPSTILGLGLTTKFDKTYPTKQEGLWKLKRFFKLILVYSLCTSVLRPIMVKTLSSTELAQDSKNMLIKHRHKFDPPQLEKYFSDTIKTQMKD